MQTIFDRLLAVVAAITAISLVVFHLQRIPEDARDRSDLTRSLQVLPDPSGALTAEAVIHNGPQAFRRITWQDGLNPEVAAYWVLATFEWSSASATEAYLQVEPTPVGSIKLYQLDQSAPREIGEVDADHSIGLRGI